MEFDIELYFDSRTPNEPWIWTDQYSQIFLFKVFTLVLAVDWRPRKTYVIGDCVFPPQPRRFKMPFGKTETVVVDLLNQ